MIKQIYFSIFIVLLFNTLTVMSQQDKSKWHQVASGVWKYQIGEVPETDLLKAAKAIPLISKINQFEKSEFPLDKEEIKFTNQNGNLYLRFPLDEEEQLYGLGLQFKTLNRRKKVYHLQVDHYSNSDNGRTHAPVPFYISSNKYGILINSARYITMYMGTSHRLDGKNHPETYDRNTDKRWTAMPVSDAVEVLIRGDESAEIIVFSGENMMEIVQKYNLYSGGGCLPPKWGLGITYRVHKLYSADDVMKEVEMFEENDFPLDFIGLEPGWMSMSYPCTYEWDEIRFPDPKGYVQGLLEKGIRTNLWMNPYISKQATLYKKMLPYSGSHTVWTGIVPDYNMEEARDLFNDFYTKEHLDIGVSGLKIDECDGYDRWLWPDVATFPSGMDADQVRQTYPLVLQEMQTTLHHDKNIRTYGLVRGSNAGASRFPFVLYSDFYNHRAFIIALINSGFSGILWTPEVRSARDGGEEWLRRIQAVCFSPMAMIDAWSSGIKPWTYPEVYEAVQYIANLRLQLLPYNYTTFAQYYFEGKPPVRPMQLVEGFIDDPKEIKQEEHDAKNPYNISAKKELNDQYMFGDNMLIAPVFTGNTSRQVALPAGKWYDFYTGVYVGEHEIITVEAPLGKIPVFVKDGGIIPLIDKKLKTVPAKGEKVPLEVRYYGTAPGEFMLYDDDGETFDFEKGQHSWTKLSVENRKGKVERIEGEVYNYTGITWNYMTK